MDAKQELLIRKERVEVSLQLVNGNVLSGSLFLFPGVGPGVFLWKRVLDFLNDTSTHFPFELSEDQIVLVSRSGVVRATIRKPEPSREDPLHYFRKEATARVVLTDGKALVGTIYIDIPPPGDRISDHLGKSCSFFHLRADGTDEVIQKAHAPEIYPSTE